MFVHCDITLLGFAVGVILVTYAIYCLYMQHVKKRCSCKTDLTGKTVIITGSDKGMWARLKMGGRCSNKSI